MAFSGAKIKELINALRESTERVKTTERENRELKGLVTDIYRAAVQMSNELGRNPTGDEIDLPALRTEDIAEYRPMQLIKNIGSTLITAGRNLVSTRAALRELASGLEGADAALDEWHAARIGSTGIDVANGFRDRSQDSTQTGRPETPKPALATPATHSTPVLSTQVPPSPPDSTTGKQGGSAKPQVSSPTLDKAKGNTTKTPAASAKSGKK